MKIDILKKFHFGKISTPENETLTHHVGHSSGEFHLRITDNTGGGFFSDEWVSLSDILEFLSEKETFSTTILDPLFQSKSANNAGFMAAALKAEGIILPIEGKKRLFSLGDVESFVTVMNKLIKKKVSLSDEVAERKAEKEAKRLADEKKFKAQRAKVKAKS